MKAVQIESVVASWLRVPSGEIREALAVGRKAGLVPGPKSRMDSMQVSSALVCVLSSFLARNSSARGMSAACDLALEAVEGVDPLDQQPREAFCRMVGRTAGNMAANGYLTFCQTLGTALSRHEENLGVVEVDSLSLGSFGGSTVGSVSALLKDGTTCSWSFTHDGRPVQRVGMSVVATIPRGVLSGVGFLLSADMAQR